MHGSKETFSVLGERQMTIVFFSVQSAAGSTLSVRWRKMLDPPFSDLSSLIDLDHPVHKSSLQGWAFALFE